jgi:hypothetical protein
MLTPNDLSTNAFQVAANRGATISSFLCVVRSDAVVLRCLRDRDAFLLYPAEDVRLHFACDAMAFFSRTHMTQ